MAEPDLILKVKIDGKETEIAVQPSDFDEFYDAYVKYRQSCERAHSAELVREAAKIAIEVGKISTSLLQRKLRIGYGRAASIINELEEMGVIGSPEGGNTPRAILISSMEEFDDKIKK